MKQFSTFLLVLSIAVLASCKKDNNSAVVTPPVVIGNKIAPDGFNFSTTKTITFNLSLRTPDNSALSGVVVSVYLADTTLSKATVFMGASDKNGMVTGTFTIPAQATQLLIKPNYAGLMNNALANINGSSVNAVIGGAAGFSGDIVARGNDVPVVNSSKTFSSGIRTNSATATEFMYPAPYTNTASAVASPQNQGKPLYLDPTNDAISNDFIAAVNNILPENGNLPSAHPEYLGSNVVNVLNVTATTDIYVNYLGSGTSSYNSLAWYSYPTNNPPTSPTGGTNNGGVDKITIVYPNLQPNGSGGGLTPGNRVKIGTFNAGTTVALCMISQGWVNNNGNYGISTTAPRFFSQDVLNPESNSSVKRHQVMFYDVATSAFVFGLEDANREQFPTNNDFNDGMVYVKSSVAGAISTANVPNLPRVNDADGDGVPDGQDYFPNDPTRAYSYGSPLYSMAFEDNFPNKGDYDMNDLVTSVSYATELNAQNQIVDMIFYTTVPAAGASFKDGFGIQLTGVASGKVSSVTGQQLISNYINLAGNGVEAGQTFATIIPFDNYNALVNNPNGSFFINTLPGVPKVQSNVSTVVVTFTSPLPQSTLTGLNPFIICNLKRGYEAHLPGYLPTDLADKTLFGKGDDTSSPTSNRYYLSAQNYPWALLFVGAPYQWPVERTSILTAYPHFADWAASGGSSFTDWYSNTSSGYRITSSLFQ